MAATLPFREALTESISSGRFEDTKIILYSRKDSSGNICGPRALYANSHVLKTVPYFTDLLSGTFAEAESKDFSDPIDNNGIAEDYGYHSDSDLEDADDVLIPGKQPGTAVLPREHPADPSTSSTRNGEPLPTYRGRKERPQQGKVIKVQDIAFVTFQAFLLYLYTDYIEFAPYGSEENHKSRATEVSCVSEDKIPRPSPKSIYRLADKYDVPSLKKLAWGAITNGLGRCDIVEEAFSGFASKYQEVRTTQVNHLASTWFRGDEDVAKRIGEKVDKKIDGYVNGEIDHAMETMALLWELSRGKKTASGTPEGTAPRAAPVFSDTIINWKHFTIALIKSIREGTFLDTKYWTRCSKSTGALRPIYISSIVVGTNLQHIDGLVKMHREGEFSNADDVFEDSDCEGEPEHPAERAPEEQAVSKEDTQLESLPVLTIGSFASWSALFFYMCTGEIKFAPLRSQGADMRAQYVKEQGTSGKAPSCSPKAVYSIATVLEIKSLRELAFDDIRSKISSENIVAELFSAFTSRENEVMKMYCELLESTFHGESITAAVADFIRSITGGKAAHCATTLKLALRNGCSTGSGQDVPQEPGIALDEEAQLNYDEEVARAYAKFGDDYEDGTGFGFFD